MFDIICVIHSFRLIDESTADLSIRPRTVENDRNKIVLSLCEVFHNENND